MYGHKVWDKLYLTGWWLQDGDAIYDDASGPFY